MKKRKTLDKKRRKQLTILFSTAIVALLILGFLQFTGIVSVFEELVLDSEHEGGGRIGISSVSSWEAQSITINQIEELKMIQLKLSRDSDANGILSVYIRNSLDGSNLWTYPMPVAIIPADKWNPGWVLVPVGSVELTPGQQVYVVFNYNPTGSGAIYFWSSGSTTDRYTGGCEYYKGPSTGNQWTPNYAPSTGVPYVDHSFKVYGISPNQPPTVPATPVGPSEGTPGTAYWFETAGSTDPEGGDVEYKWDYGDGTPHPWYNPRTVHSFSSTGTYQVKVKARDTLGAESEWSSPMTITISQDVQNHAPSIPSYSAWEETLNVGEVGTWTAVSNDPDGHNIFYTWEVDGDVERQHGFVSSGTSDSLSFTFTSAGSHTISVRVRDTPGLYSDWATKTILVGEEGEQGQPGEPTGYQTIVNVVDSTTYSGISEASVICNGELKTTNSEGIATYILPVGTYTATVSATGYVTDDVSIGVTTSGGSASIYLIPSSGGDGGEQEPPAEGFYLITVEVLDDSTNLPIENAKVTANNIEKFTNADGVVTYSLEGDGSTYSVSVIASGYNSDLKTTTIYDVSKTVSFYLIPLGGSESPSGGESGTSTGAETPGFEFMVFFIAIGIAFIYFQKKRRL